MGILLKQIIIIIQEQIPTYKALIYFLLPLLQVIPLILLMLMFGMVQGERPEQSLHRHH